MYEDKVPNCLTQQRMVIDQWMCRCHCRYGVNYLEIAGSIYKINQKKKKKKTSSYHLFQNTNTKPSKVQQLGYISCETRAAQTATTTISFYAFYVPFSSCIKSYLKTSLSGYIN